MTHTNCFLPGAYLRRAGSEDSQDLVAVQYVKKGDVMKGPEGDVVVAESWHEWQKVLRDVVEIQSSRGNLWLTKDHRVDVLRGTLAAGELRDDDFMLTRLDPVEAEPVKVRLIKNCTTDVYYVRFHHDKPAYVLTTAQFVTKGCPGDASFAGGPFGTAVMHDSSPRRISSAPPSSTGGALLLRRQEDLHEKTAVIFKRRRAEDPDIFTLLRQFAEEAQCKHLLSGITEVSKHELVLPCRIANQLQVNVGGPYQRWCERRLLAYPGTRNSKLEWKPLGRT